ncbi:MAG: alpha-L-fucosidase [Carboxylicivirga sp.]|nr:alpha-L-fucosidase [Carboxylicivirga sp.]
MRNKTLCFFMLVLFVFGSCTNTKKEKIKDQASSLPVPYYLKGYEKYGLEPQINGDTIRASKAAYEWYRDATFGMFIHWGLYCQEGKHEWEMQLRQWKIKDYEALAPKFNPVEFDAKEWVSIAKDAGMKYMVITSKHHDGFALFETEQGDWDIMDRTPYKKDIIKALAEECQKQGIAFGLYHSHLDWHHSDYYPRGYTGWNNGRPESGDFSKYIDYMNAQVKELSSGKYGPISSWWFDGVWDIKDSVDWRMKETYDIIHKALPHSMVGNNRFSVPMYGEDYQVFERSLPGHNTYKNNTKEVSKFPLESADTMNKHWGYNTKDKDFKSVKTLVHYLVRAAGINGNLLLNVGPPPSGKFQPEVVKRLKEIGQWNKKYGESIFKTRGGPMGEQMWGVMTQGKEGGKTYLHILDDPKTNKLVVPVSGNVTGVKLFATGEAVPFELKDGLVIDLSNIELDEIDTILIIEKEGKLVAIP